MRKLFNLIGCRLYGHHPWVLSGIKFGYPDDGGLDLSVETALDGCKRCGKGTRPRYIDWESKPLYTVRVTEVIMHHVNGQTHNKVSHEIRPIEEKTNA